MNQVLVEMIEGCTGKIKNGLLEEDLKVSGRDFPQIIMLIQTLGKALKEDPEQNTCLFVINVGFANMAYAYVAIQKENNVLHVLVYAKEGLIKQGLAKKAMAKVKGVIYGNGQY